MTRYWHYKCHHVSDTISNLSSDINGVDVLSVTVHAFITANTNCSHPAWTETSLWWSDTKWAPQIGGLQSTYNLGAKWTVDAGGLFAYSRARVIEPWSPNGGLAKSQTEPGCSDFLLGLARWQL